MSAVIPTSNNVNEVSPAASRPMPINAGLAAELSQMESEESHGRAPSSLGSKFKARFFPKCMNRHTLFSSSAPGVEAPASASHMSSRPSETTDEEDEAAYKRDKVTAHAKSDPEWWILY
ncbi:hypothetical protein IAR50_006660 [Cryptococcus sp. DSM 104548]